MEDREEPKSPPPGAVKPDPDAERIRSAPTFHSPSAAWYAASGASAAVLDERTCDYCRRHHGQQYDTAPSKTVPREGCTSPDGCRCVTKPLAEEGIVQTDKPKHMTLSDIRAARDQLESVLAASIYRAISAFHRATGVSVQGIEVDMVDVGTCAAPRTRKLRGVQVDLGRL